MMQKPANFPTYDQLCQSFSWAKEKTALVGSSDSEGLNIAYLAVDRNATGENGKNIALRCIRKDLSHHDYTYQDLKEATNRFANILNALKIEKGDRVFSLLNRVPELYIAALGTLKQRAIFCPLFSVFGPEPVFQRLYKGDASVLITNTSLFEKKIKPLMERLPGLKYVLITDSDDDLEENILSLPKLSGKVSKEFTISPTSPEDPALLHFTSGTTGMPKGALHVHNAGLMHYATGKYILGFQPGDVYWCTADPGWVTGTSYGIISPLINGVTNIVDEEEFDALRWYSILDSQKVNVWYTAPTAIRRLMRMDFVPKDKYRLENLRLILSVGEPLHAEAVIWGEKAFGMPIRDNWWQTETGGIVVSNYSSLPVKPGSMGKPLPGLEVAIAEVTETDLTIISEPDKEGHLVIKKGWPSMFRGYLHDDDRYKKSFRGDWYISGDLARRDKDGYYWFIGRADDIIKTSGHMVGPFEVESVLMQHPLVAEAAVIGIPDAIIGELVKAYIVLKTGYAENEKVGMDIIGFARRKLGPAVAPKSISFIESLPKTRSGKILRRLLKARELKLPEGDLSTLESS